MADETAEDDSTTAEQREQDLNRAVEQIKTSLRNLRFGSVTISVQDGVIVQIERTERTRLARPGRR